MKNKPDLMVHYNLSVAEMRGSQADPGRLCGQGLAQERPCLKGWEGKCRRPACEVGLWPPHACSVHDTDAWEREHTALGLLAASTDCPVSHRPLANTSVYFLPSPALCSHTQDTHSLSLSSELQWHFVFPL